VRILQYNNLSDTGLRQAFERTVVQLAAGDFRAADVKKLNPGPFYRAKLSDADRLIFRFGEWRGETCLILLEIVRNHAYESSRFLRGAVVDETKLTPVPRAEPLLPEDRLPLAYINPERPHVHLLDKILSFDEDQENALVHAPPLILIGSAGSGKTVLSIEKLRQLPGEVLYVTHSPFLVDNARSLYFAHHYENDAQEVDFLSFLEFVQSIAVPPGRPLAFADFAGWFARVRGGVPVRDSHAIYEEFNGVLTGSSPGQPYLTREEYLSLGVRRSIFSAELRPAIYDLFRRYLDFLPGSGGYDLNLVCHDHHARCRPAYDFLVVDEVQDLTAVQLSLAIQSLRRPGQFVLCGDSNQIVHPNFFSWAGVKTFFHERNGESHAELARVLNVNYRNAPAVTEVANRLLRIKQARFGSIDRESHYLIRPLSDRPGEVTFLEDTEAARRDLDRKTARSARFAVIVLREEDKEEARRCFRTPLVFSVREAKGLEYDHIILPGLITSQPGPFREIASGVSETDLEGDFTYSRARDKSDHSLDAYKFFVNSLYVALTRAISHVYILERDSNHPLLRLLRLRTGAAAELAEQRSTEAEWREEALRLERQGKLDQVEAIRRTILHVEPVPWPVLTPAAAETLAREALAPGPANQKAQRLLLDYAATYTVPHLLRALAKAGVKSAGQPDVARNTAQQRHGVDYHQHGYRDLLRKTEQHGIDFRNPLNQTPLMLATLYGFDALVVQLLDRGASLTQADNWGRIPLHLALRAAYQNPLYAKHSLARLYPRLCPPATNVRIGQRLVQVDNHRMTFFLLHSMLARFEMILRTKILTDVPGFETGDFVHALESFPDSVIPARRRTRQAITAALAGNEVHRDAPHNRRLFVRIRHGYYLPNPCMELEQNGEWINVLDRFHVGDLEREADNAPLLHFLAYLRKLQTTLPALLDAAPANARAAPAPADADRGETHPDPTAAAPASADAGPTTEPEPVAAAPAPDAVGLVTEPEPVAAAPAPDVVGPVTEPEPVAAAPAPDVVGPVTEPEPVAAAPAPDAVGPTTEPEPTIVAPALDCSSVTERQMTLDFGEAPEAATPAAQSFLLPDRARLAPLPPAPASSTASPLTPKAAMRRHDQAMRLLRHEAFAHLNELRWLMLDPHAGVACLLEFLNDSLANRPHKIDQARIEGCQLALLLLGYWRETRAFPLVVKLLGRGCVTEWTEGWEPSTDDMAAAVAATCDGELAPLRELMLDVRADSMGWRVAVATISHLALRRGLDAGIARDFYRTLLAPDSFDRLPPRGRPTIINRAAGDASRLYPVELRGELEAAMRRGLVPRSVLTLKQLAALATYPEWERAQILDMFYAPPPDDFWAYLKASIGEPSGATELDDDWVVPLNAPSNPAFRANGAPGRAGAPFGGPDFSSDSTALPPGDALAAGARTVGRNDPCPCGSGRKFKKCCGT
jgi:hypothetical protein